MSVSLNVAAEIERGAAEVRGMEIQVGWMYDALGCRLIRPFTRCFYLSAIRYAAALNRPSVKQGIYSDDPC